MRRNGYMAIFTENPIDDISICLFLGQFSLAFVSQISLLYLFRPSGPSTAFRKSIGYSKSIDDTIDLF